MSALHDAKAFVSEDWGQYDTDVEERAIQVIEKMIEDFEDLDRLTRALGSRLAIALTKLQRCRDLAEDMSTDGLQQRFAQRLFIALAEHSDDPTPGDGLSDAAFADWVQRFMLWPNPGIDSTPVEPFIPLSGRGFGGSSS
ncbi:hypothetical protein [Gordonia sp. N1V]|uniref:hypothetical protein n=1 Tax=Gordonia sp. N1V TaxID=3034163 RepID=UPI0023E27B61|nr:hypothetical protein [Gordonia sp. N1V]MDF3280880.1 hypothetical protein [Gordonia sp. N1V]